MQTVLTRETRMMTNPKRVEIHRRTRPLSLRPKVPPRSQKNELGLLTYLPYHIGHKRRPSRPKGLSRPRTRQKKRRMKQLPKLGHHTFRLGKASRIMSP